MSIILSGKGIDDNAKFTFSGYAIKSSVKMIILKNTGSNAWITGFDEVTVDGVACATAVNYYYSSPAEEPGNWYSSGTVPPYMIEMPPDPAGVLEIDFTYNKHTTSAPFTAPAGGGMTEQSQQNQSQSEWEAKKVVMDKGIWVQCVDDSQLEKGKPLSKFQDVIDVLIADEESAKRWGRNIIWESIKKNEGYFPTVFNPKLKPGDYILTSYSHRFIFNWLCRVRGITFLRNFQNQKCNLYIKERAYEGE